jgi:hypothetical protein
MGVSPVYFEPWSARGLTGKVDGKTARGSGTGFAAAGYVAGTYKNGAEKVSGVLEGEGKTITGKKITVTAAVKGQYGRVAGSV